MNECELNSDRLLADAYRVSRRQIVQRQAELSAIAPASTARRQTPVESVKVERRRQIDPTTCERDYTGDELEFMRAMDDYKRRSGRQFPTWSEVLEVVRSLGYQRP